MTDPVNITLQRLLDLKYPGVLDRSKYRDVLSPLTGQVPSEKRGDGMEFDDLRPYAIGDDVRHIDWNVTARTAETHVRIFRAEQERNVCVILDLSPASFLGVQGLRAVTQCEIAAILLWRSSARGDKTSLALFDGRSIQVTKPKIGDRGVLPALGLVATEFSRCKQQETTPKASQSGHTLLEWIAGLGRIVGNVMLVSHLDFDCDRDFALLLSTAARRRHLALYWIKDHFENMALPVGGYAYKADGNNRLVNIGRSDRPVLQQHLLEQSDEIRSMLDSIGIEFWEIDAVKNGTEDHERYQSTAQSV